MVKPYPENMSQELEQLKHDPQILKQIQWGMQARLEGRVKSWDKVKNELGI